MISLLELFGGIGAPRAALRNIGADFESYGYVEIDKHAVDSYNAIFDEKYKPISVRQYQALNGIDILFHGSPCQDFSICGNNAGGYYGSGTRSSLLWETLRIIFDVYKKPKIVIWENVENVLSRKHKHVFYDYLYEMEELGYKSYYSLLNAMDFGVPQSRKRIFVVSVLKTFSKKPFDFNSMERNEMRDVYSIIDRFDYMPCHVIVSQSMLSKIKPGVYDKGSIDSLTEINKHSMTISTRQDRCPNAGIVKIGDKKYRLLTEKECWKLMGFSDNDYYKAESANPRKNNKKNGILYKQAGNSIVVPILESMFKAIINEYFEGTLK